MRRWAVQQLCLQPSAAAAAAQGMMVGSRAVLKAAAAGRPKGTHGLARGGVGGAGQQQARATQQGRAAARLRRQGSSLQQQQRQQQRQQGGAAELASRVDPLWGTLHAQEGGAAQAALSAVGDSDPAQLRGATYTGASAVIAEAAGHAHSVHEREVASKMRPHGLRSAAHRAEGEAAAAAAAPPSGRAFSLVGSTQEPERPAAPVDPDLLTLEQAHPQLAAQWDHELNAHRSDLHPQKTPVKKLRKAKIAWACSVAPDHRWMATLQQRLRNTKCPCCADKQVSTTNSLATVRPEIAAEFHPTLNRPDATLPDGHSKVRLHTRTRISPSPN